MDLGKVGFGMTEPVNGLVAFTAMVLCGFFAVIGIALWFWWQLRKGLNAEAELIKQRLDEWVGE